MNHTKKIIFKEGKDPFALALKLKSWIQLFKGDEYKLLLSAALNHLIEHKGMILLGYLIQRGDLFLVLGNKEKEKDELIGELDHFLKKEIEQNWEWQNSINRGADEQQRYFQSHSIYKDDLFDIRPLLNQDLIALLIGKTIHRKHHDAALQKMEDDLIRENFASVKELRFGIKGPVKLKHYYKERKESDENT